MQYILTEEEYNNLVFLSVRVDKEYDDNSIVFTKEQALQILCCLENATYITTQEDEESYGMTRDQRSNLIDMEHEISYNIGDKFDIVIGNGYVDIDTLEYTEFL